MIKRYELVHLENDDSFMCDYTDNSGDWVKYEDHAEVVAGLNNELCARQLELDELKAERLRLYLRRDVLTYLLYQDGREPPREADAGDLGL